MLPSLVDDVLVDLVGDRNRVPFAAEGRDRLELGAGEHFAGRIVRCVQDDGLRPVIERSRELVRIERPIGFAQRDVARRSAGKDRVRAVVLVKRLEDHHFVARIDDGHHRRHHRLGRAAADGHLFVGDHRHTIAARELAGDGLAKRPGSPRHRVLVDVLLDGGARRILDGLRRRKVGKSLRQVHPAVPFIEARHLADDRLGELRRFLRSNKLRHTRLGNRVIGESGNCSWRIPLPDYPIIQSPDSFRV